MTFWCKQCQQALLKCMAKALEERFSCFTDPLFSITHRHFHNQFPRQRKIGCMQLLCSVFGMSTDSIHSPCHAAFLSSTHSSSLSHQCFGVRFLSAGPIYTCHFNWLKTREDFTLLFNFSLCYNCINAPLSARLKNFFFQAELMLVWAILQVEMPFNSLRNTKACPCTVSGYFYRHWNG